MPERKRALSAYLTREEWQLCFAVSFAHQYLGDAGPFDSLADELRYAITYLSQNGMDFEALAVAADGRIVPTQEEPVCEGNLASCALIVYGGSPDYETHLPAAIAYAEEVVPHLHSDIEMLREALADVSQTVEDNRRSSRLALAERLGEGAPFS